MDNIKLNNSPIAFAEVYDIIQHSDKTVKEKIPQKFMQVLRKNMDKNYKVNIDYNKSFSNQESLQYETKVILGIIYRDFLCDAETKKRLLERDKKELEEIEKQKQEKYSYDNLFKKTETYIPVQESKEIIEYKQEKWYTKLWNKLKCLFKK